MEPDSHTKIKSKGRCTKINHEVVHVQRSKGDVTYSPCTRAARVTQYASHAAQKVEGA